MTSGDDTRKPAGKPANCTAIGPSNPSERSAPTEEAAAGAGGDLGRHALQRHGEVGLGLADGQAIREPLAAETAVSLTRTR